MKPKMVFSFMDKCVLFLTTALLNAVVFENGAWAITDSCLSQWMSYCQTQISTNGSYWPGSQCFVNWDSIGSNGSWSASIWANAAGGPHYDTCPDTHEGKCQLMGACSGTFAGGGSTGPKPTARYPGSACGSIVHIDNQAVGESVPVAGTPFNLVYFSNRAAGRTNNFDVWIPIDDGDDQGGTRRAFVTTKIAGRTITWQGGYSSGSKYHFQWDGLDNNGNVVIGMAKADFSVAFGFSGPDPGDIPMPYSYMLGTYRPIYFGLGGWTLSIHHFYDGQWLHQGDGVSRQAAAGFMDSSTHWVVPSEDGSELFVFDLTGKHLKTLNALTGAVLYTFSYDAQNHLQSVTDAYSNQTLILHDTAGKPTSILAPYGQTTQLTVDSNGYLASVQNPNGDTYHMTYVNSGGLLQTFQKPRGQVSTFSYSTDGLLLTDSSSAGNSTTITPLNATNFRVTDAMSIISNVSATNNSTGYHRTNTGPDFLTDTLNFNKGSSLAMSSPSESQSITFSPDVRFGSLLDFADSKLISEDTLRTQMYFRQIISGWNQGSDPNNPDYFNFTTLDKRFTLNGNLWDSLYTASTHQSQMTSPVGRVSNVSTDNLGKVTSQSFASYAPVQFGYDTHGRLSQITQGTRQSTVAYNSSGWVDHLTDPLNRTVSFTYDNAGRVLTQTLPDTRTISYSYDSNGNVTSVTPPGKTAHGMSFNDFDLVSGYQPPALTPPQSVNTVYSYNNDKQLTQIQRPNGSTVNFNYDSSTSYLTSITVPNGQYTFDYSNRLPYYFKSPDGIRLFRGYQGALPSQDDFRNGNAIPGGLIMWGWDQNLKLVNSDVESGNGSAGSSISFTYDNDGLLTQAGNESLTRNLSSGLLTGTSLYQVSDSFSYNSTYAELSAYSAQFNPTPGSPSVLFSQTFTRDALGRITGNTETVAGGSSDTYVYTFDVAGRLTDVTLNGSAYSHYNYDSNSNRTSGNAGGVSFTATYDSQDRLTAYDTKSYTYTLNGERLTMTDSSLPSGAQTTTYTYDAFGNLKQVATPTQTIAYKLDGLNRRQSKWLNGTVVAQYIYEDQYRVGAVLNASGAITARFVYGSKPNVPDYMIKSGTTYKIISDPNGSVRLVVDSSTGVVAQELEYDEFGDVLTDTSPGFQPFGFAGGFYDSETGLTHFGVRDYDASVGRWLQKDPILFAGGDTNLYGYVLQDPINWIDQDGLNRKQPEPGAGGEFGVLEPFEPIVRPPGRFSPDQSALIDLAKQSLRKGVNLNEAKILQQWSEELNLQFRGPEVHPNRPYGANPHIHLGPIDHIPVNQCTPK